mgnify:CR=1 FL=1
MTRTTDELLAEIRSLSSEIERTADGSPEHTRLVARRDALRAEAADRSDAMRHPESVRMEIERIEARLAAYEARLIKGGYNERHLGRTIQDPGAYRHAINRLLAEQDADDIDDLRNRLVRLRRIQTAEPSESHP